MAIKQQTVRRRDFLFVVAGTAAATGALTAAWPLLQSMNPAADVMDHSVSVDLALIQDGGEKSFMWLGLPIYVSKRTQIQMDEIRMGRSPRPVRDPDSISSEQPTDARNWHRSLRPDVAVMIAICTREGCIVRRHEADASGAAHYRCPCCGSGYDLAGRVFMGPAPTNLRVPPYVHYGADELIIGRGDPLGR